METFEEIYVGLQSASSNEQGNVPGKMFVRLNNKMEALRIYCYQMFVANNRARLFPTFPNTSFLKASR